MLTKHVSNYAMTISTTTIRKMTAIIKTIIVITKII